MAIDTNIYKSDAASADYINPTYWDKKIEQAARERTVMLQFGVENTTLLNKDGKQINIAKNQVFSAADLTEGTQTPVTSMAYDQVTVTVKEVGLAKQVSQLELDYAFETVMNDIINNMGLAIGEKLEQDIINACVAGAGSTVYPNGTSSSSITASDTLDFEELVDAIKALHTNKRTPKALVIHPEQEASLFKLKDTAGNYIFVNAAVYGGREAILNGEIGKILGVKVFVSTFIPTVTENTDVTVYEALMLGERPFVVAWKRKPQIKFREDSILDRAITFSATATYGVSVLNDDSIVLVKSA